MHGDLRGISSTHLRFVLSAAVGIEQADGGLRDFCEESLRLLLAFAGLQAAKVARPLIGRIGDDVGVGFKATNAQQPIVIRRLFFRWNPKPDVIGIKRLCHTFARFAFGFCAPP